MILAVASASVFAAHIPPMWYHFSASILVLVVAIYFQRKSLKQEILNAKEESYSLESFEKFLRELESALQKVLALGVEGEESANMLENSIERITIEMDYFRVNIAEEIGIGKYTEVITTFAKAERKLNRGYSALIDGYREAAEENLTEALRLVKNSLEVVNKFIREKES